MNETVASMTGEYSRTSSVMDLDMIANHCTVKILRATTFTDETESGTKMYSPFSFLSPSYNK